jgi:hypothetical protein
MSTSTENWNRYRALKAAALNAALRTSGHDALGAMTAVRANLVQLLGLFALLGAKGNRDARRLVPGLDAPVSSKHGGGDFPGRLALENGLRTQAAQRRLLSKAAGRSSLSKERLARMVRALAH